MPFACLFRKIIFDSELVAIGGTLKLMQSEIARDRKQPGGKFSSIRFVARQVFPGAQKCFLRQFFRLGLAATHSSKEAEQWTLKMPHQACKGMPVACIDSLYSRWNVHVTDFVVCSSLIPANLEKVTDYTECLVRGNRERHT
jgi:hypothetical protein